MYRDSLHTDPLPVRKSKRKHAISAFTSARGGQFVPLAAIPMLREDSLVGVFKVTSEMLETHRIIMNPVKMRLTAWAFPWMACERFEGDRGQFDRSYMGQPQIEGGDVIPFIETHAYGTFGANKVYRALGLHGKSTDQVNTMILEAYNGIWNHIAKLRSPKLTPRDRLATTLAPAFWSGTRFDEITPDFDQAVIDGKVALQVVSGQLDVKSPGAPFTARNISADETSFKVSPSDSYVGAHALYAELAAGSLQISLADIALARKAQSLAKYRQNYEDQQFEYQIDMLMDGLSVPDMALSQPWMVADEIVDFTMAQRYATDSGNLDESAVSGATRAEIKLRVPRVPTGAIVMVFAEVMPEQIYERQKDPFFHLSDARDSEDVPQLIGLPSYTRDYLDPEKVHEVLNGDIDTSHTDPGGVFGFEPLNGRWNRFGPRVGGKFMRPAGDSLADTERLRLWAPETVDPVLTEDFYVVNDLHHEPFLDPNGEPFHFMAAGLCEITGLTQFGGRLVEATDNYDKVLDQAPVERIEKE